MSQGEVATSTPEPMSASRTIDVLADPAKMVTVLALSTFSPEQGATFSELATRYNDLQGEQQTRTAIRETMIQHCQRTLILADLVELRTDATPYAVRLTEKGATLGMSIVGAQLGLQLETPHEGFYERAMGTRADVTRDNPRVPMYREILANGPASVTQLARAADISSGRTTHFVQGLTDEGVLSERQIYDLEQYTYLLAAGDFPVTTKTNEIATIILEAATTLRRTKHVVTAQELLDQVSKIKPAYPQKEVWKSLRIWHHYKPHRNGLIRPVEAETNYCKTKVDISTDFKPDIAQMLNIRNFLTSDTKHAKKFQANARQDARDIAHSPELIRKVLAYKTGHARKAEGSNWAEVVEAICRDKAAEGVTEVSLEEVRELAMARLGQSVTMIHFARLLQASPSLEVREETPMKRGGRLSKFVTRKAVDTPDE